MNIEFLSERYIKGVVSRDCLCQLRPLVYSFDLNNPPRICLTPRKSCVKNLLRNKKGNCRCKMTGTGIHSFAYHRSQMPRIATTGKVPWQTALEWRIAKLCAQVARNVCGQVRPVAIRSQMCAADCGNPRDGYSILGNPRSKWRGMPQSATHI
jgi:hypothetical protein